MKLNYRSSTFLIFGLFLFVFSIGLNGVPAAAQTYNTEKLRAEQYDMENRARFKAWRASIPDYDKRVYDRLKSINSRTVRMQNILIGIAILVLLNFILLFALYNREIEEDSSDGTNALSGDDSDSGPADK